MFDECWWHRFPNFPTFSQALIIMFSHLHRFSRPLWPYDKLMLDDVWIIFFPDENGAFHFGVILHFQTRPISTVGNTPPCVTSMITTSTCHQVLPVLWSGHFDQVKRRWDSHLHRGILSISSASPTFRILWRCCFPSIHQLYPIISH